MLIYSSGCSTCPSDVYRYNMAASSTGEFICPHGECTFEDRYGDGTIWRYANDVTASLPHTNTAPIRAHTRACLYIRRGRISSDILNIANISARVTFGQIDSSNSKPNQVHPLHPTALTALPFAALYCARLRDEALHVICTDTSTPTVPLFVDTRVRVKAPGKGGRGGRRSM